MKLHRFNESNQNEYYEFLEQKGIYLRYLEDNWNQKIILDNTNYKYYAENEQLSFHTRNKAFKETDNGNTDAITIGKTRNYEKVVWVHMSYDDNSGVIHSNNSRSAMAFTVLTEAECYEKVGNKNLLDIFKETKKKGFKPVLSINNDVNILDNIFEATDGPLGAYFHGFDEIWYWLLPKFLHFSTDEVLIRWWDKTISKSDKIYTLLNTIKERKIKHLLYPVEIDKSDSDRFFNLLSTKCGVNIEQILSGSSMGEMGF